MYVTIGIFVFLSLSLFGIVLVPFNGRIRRFFIGLLTPSTKYDDADAYRFLKAIDDGFASPAAALDHAIVWSLVSLMILFFAAILATVWPLTLTLLSIGIIFYSSIKKQS
jgi:hypothetical protein